MAENTRLVRNTMALVFVGALWFLLYTGILPLTEADPLLRGLKIVLALLIVVGLIPGMFLNTWIRGLADRAPAARQGSLIWATLVIPLLLFALFLVFAVADLGYLATARDLGLSAGGESRTLIFNAGTCLIWLATLILNGLTVLAARRSGSVPR
jgi:hypothetical protein